MKFIQRNIFIYSIISAFFITFLFVGEEHLLTSNIFEYGISFSSCSKLVASIDLGSFIFTCLFFTILIYVLIYNRRILCNYLYTHRMHIALIILLVLVLFEISGSSIASWNVFNPGIEDNGILFGKFRTIRSDEWAVNTPMALSQYFNNGGAFNYFSNIIRGTSTDSFIVYGQPVMDIAVLFRPFHWGYLLLNSARGLSFFWCARLIALFITSFELGMIVTKKDKKLSVIFMLLIGFSPILQWWFAVNGLVEMFVFGQLAIIMLTKYMKESSARKRIPYVIVMTICAGGYILVFYPAQQIPMFYAFLGLAAWTILENYKSFKYDVKKDSLILGIAFFCFAGIMLHIILNSFDTIKTVTETAYPGSRFVNGGNEFLRLFHYPSNFFLPFDEYLIPQNPCEDAVFIDFFPLGFVLMGLILLKDKIKDHALIILTAIDIFLILFCSVQWPDILVKITLLSNCTPIRVFAAVGFLNVLILIRSLTIMKYKFSPIVASCVSIGISISIVLLCKNYVKDYMSVTMCIISLILLFLCFNSILLRNTNRKYENLLIALISFVMVYSGFTINPIQMGIRVVKENELILRIKDVVEQDAKGLWIVDVEGFPIMNIPMMAGAPTINSTNVYPDLDRWSKFDAKNEFTEIYNRYAHIRVEITQEVTRFTLDNPDVFSVFLNVNDIKKLDAAYIVSPRNLMDYNNDNVTFELISQANNHNIFKVNYHEENEYENSNFDSLLQ